MGHFLLLTKDSKLFVWGGGYAGQLGLSQGDEIRDLPELLKIPFENSHENIVDVACGEASSFVVTDSGNVYGWGTNSCGQMGSRDPDSKGPWYSPKKILLPDGIKISEIGGGFNHVIARTTEGEVYGWGNNHNGELGLGSEKRSFPPTKIPISEEVSEIFCGGQNSFALTKNGNLYACGWNGSGALGLGDSEEHSEPSLVPIRGVIGVASGNGHGILLLEDGTVATFGGNNYCALGTGDKNPRMVPTKIEFPDLEPSELMVSVGTGNNHSWAISNYGKLYMWGYGFGGLLGFGDEKSKLVPTLHEGFRVTTRMKDLWNCTFRWLFLGKDDENSAFGVFPIEVLYHVTQVAYENKLFFSSRVC
jgi:alpha-tubulin suppressor-like RCC1 family protein